jgi:hypothetical protein
MIKYPAVKSMQKQINMTVGAAVMGFMEAALADAAAADIAAIAAAAIRAAGISRGENDIFSRGARMIMTVFMTNPVMIKNTIEGA